MSKASKANITIQRPASLTSSATLGNFGNVYIATTSGITLSLPSPVVGAGRTYNIYIQSPASSSSHSIVSPSASIIGSINSCIVTAGVSMLASTAKTSIATTAGSAAGDHLELYSSGVNWYLTGNVANFNACVLA